MLTKAYFFLGLAAATTWRMSFLTLASNFLVGTRFSISFRPFSIVRLP